MPEYSLNVGYYNNPWEDPLWIEKLIASGAKWVRVDVPHGDIGSESWNFLKFLKENGLKILGIFGQRVAPWVSGGWEPIADLDHWRQLVQRALNIYGEFLDAIECWNEPDLPKFHSGYMDGTPWNYFEMLKVLYEEVQNYNPNIPIIAGSIATMRDTQTTPGDFYGGYFLRRIHEMGAYNYCHAYSIHIYAWFLTGYNDLYTATDVYNRAKSIAGAKPVWITEMGHGATEEEQATQIETWFTELSRVNCPFITWFPYYGSTAGEIAYAIVRQDLSEKPSYYIFQRFATVTPIPLLEILGPAFAGLGLYLAGGVM